MTGRLWALSCGACVALSLLATAANRAAASTCDPTMQAVEQLLPAGTVIREDVDVVPTVLVSPRWRTAGIVAFRIVTNGHAGTIYFLHDQPIFQAAERGETWARYVLAALLVHELAHEHSTSEKVAMQAERAALVGFIKSGKLTRTGDFDPFAYLADLDARIARAPE